MDIKNSLSYMSFITFIKENEEIKLLYWATEIDLIVTKVKDLMISATFLVTVWCNVDAHPKKSIRHL